MKNLKKIAVIVESIDIDDSSGSKANVALIQNLHLIGYEVIVYHFTRKEIQLKNIKCFSIKETKKTLYFLSRIQRVFSRLTKLDINPFIERFIGFSFTFFNDVKSIKKAIKKEIDFNPDLILTLSKGASFRPHYAVLKLPDVHHKWLAYVHDPYPFHCYPKPYDWVEPGYKKKEAFFKSVSEKAKYSAFPSLLLKEWMSNYFPNFLITGVVIPHQNLAIKTNVIKFPNYFDNSKFNMLHSGNLMKQRSPKGLIEGFKLFLSKNPKAIENARLFLLGNANYHHQMLIEYTKKIPELLVNTSNISFDIIFHLQQHVAVNIILESKSEISPFLPGKFPHCIAANKPIFVLGPNHSETRRLLGEDYPYWAEVDSISEIADKIKKLYTLWVENSDNLKLNRPDLENYISTFYLKEVITSLN